MSYELIALDMDGTLLNSEKKISPKTLEAINKAFDEGKQVVFSTGRCMAELTEFLRLIPRLRFLVCVSGGIVFDTKKYKMIYNQVLTPEQISEILDVAKDKDVMIHILSVESYVQSDKIEIMEKYHMGVYKDMYREVCTDVDDIIAYFHEHPQPFEKINLYHTSKEEREITYNQLKHLPLELKFAEGTSLEISPLHVNKGNGLLKLCEYLDIDVSQAIAVGDADNDTDILKVAGLPIAMGNALPSIKEISKVIVNDNDHDGCADAIYDYLLK